MVKTNRIPVCGVQSTEIQPKFSVICTETPNHEGDHRTVFSVNPADNTGFEYSWPQEYTPPNYPEGFPRIVDGE